MTQTEYIAILFTDCGYDTVSQRKGWLASRFYGAQYADDLLASERSRAIEMLKNEKEDKATS